MARTTTVSREAARESREAARRRGRRQRTYRVRRGDDLFKISERLYGQNRQRGAQRIARANPNVKRIKPGIVLKVPEPEPVSVAQQPPLEYTPVPAPVGPPVAPEPAQQPTYFTGSFTAPRAQFTPLAVQPQQPAQEPGYQGRRGALRPAQEGAAQPVQNLFTGAQPSTQATQYKPIGATPTEKAAGAPRQLGGVPLASYGPYATPISEIFQQYQFDPDNPPPNDYERPWGTSIVGYLIDQGIPPLAISNYDVKALGINEALLEEFGYIKDDWGTWLRPQLTAEIAPPGGGGGGGGGYAYGGGGGYGRSRQPARSITGRKVSPIGGINLRELGPITWRI